jgi:hypothetical protein
MPQDHAAAMGMAFDESLAETLELTAWPNVT